MSAANYRNYVYRDNRRRLRDDRLSLILSLAASFLMLALGQPERIAAIAGLAVLGVCMFYFTARYCLIAPQIPARRSRDYSGRYAILYRPVTRRLAWFSAAAIGLLAAFPLREVEAAVVDRRLLKLTRDPVLSPEQAKQVARTLDAASSQKPLVKLSEETKIRVRDAVKASAQRSPYSPFVDAADAFVRYVREAEPGVPPALEAIKDASAHYAGTFHLLPSGQIAVDRAEAEKAITALTRAIELSGSDTDLRRVALAARASLYNFVDEPDKALADIDASERLGYAELSEIISVESTAFYLRAGRDHNSNDLNRAVSLLTLAILLPPPRSLPYGEATYRSGLHGQRGTAFLNLGQYKSAIDDFRKVLQLLNESGGQNQVAAGMAFAEITLCYLRLGDLPSALEAVDQWQEATHDTFAARVRGLLESDPKEGLRTLQDFLDNS
jgi:tetratricopeptide (TPR) repeat protein